MSDMPANSKEQASVEIVASSPAAPEVLDGVTVAGARAFWKAQDLLNTMQAIATGTMVALSDPHRTADEYRSSLGGACQLALNAIDAARPMEPQEAVSSPAPPASTTACGLTTDELHRAVRQLDKQAGCGRAEHEWGAVPSGVQCRWCRCLLTGADAEAVWRHTSQPAPPASGDVAQAGWDAKGIAERYGAPGVSGEALRALVEALRWLVHLGHGVGKAGGEPEPGEWEAAIEAGVAALAPSVSAPPEPHKS